MAVNFGILTQQPSPIEQFMVGQQQAQQNALAQQQMEVQRENLLAQREQRAAVAAETRAKTERAVQRQRFLEDLGRELASDGYKLDRPTLGKLFARANQAGEEHLAGLAFKGLQALDETERETAEMQRLGFLPPAGAGAPAGAAPTPIGTTASVAPTAIGTTQPEVPAPIGTAPVNALAPAVQAPAAAPVNALAGITREQVQQMLLSPNARVRERGKALAQTIEKPYTPSADMQGYELAKSEGFKGTFFDYKRQLAEAGRAPAQPREPSAPIAVVDEATNKVKLVSREEAIGKTPASALESLPPKEIQKREAVFPQATSAIKSIEAKSDSFIKDLTALRDHPGLSQITGIAAGRLPGITAEGRAAQALYDKVVAKGGFEALQSLREASKTGGALGNVSNQEGKQLIASFAAIDRRQNAEDVRKAIDAAIADVQGAKARTREAYDSTYSYKSTPPAAGTATAASAAPVAPAGAPTAPAPVGMGNALSPQRDAEAGMLRIRSEYGGDLNRARAELTAMRQSIASAPRTKGGSEARAMLENEANLLEAGINAMSRGAPSGTAPAATPRGAGPTVSNW